MKIHTVYQASRKKPYIARWYEESRQRNKFFSTEEARAALVIGNSCCQALVLNDSIRGSKHAGRIAHGFMEISFFHDCAH